MISQGGARPTVPRRVLRDRGDGPLNSAHLGPERDMQPLRASLLRLLQLLRRYDLALYFGNIEAVGIFAVVVVSLVVDSTGTVKHLGQRGEARGRAHGC